MHRERTNMVRGSFVQIEIITQFGITHDMELKICISQCRKIRNQLEKLEAAKAALAYWALLGHSWSFRGNFY